MAPDARASFYRCAGAGDTADPMNESSGAADSNPSRFLAATLASAAGNCQDCRGVRGRMEDRPGWAIDTGGANPLLKTEGYLS